jgi:hypothetical protein
VSAGACQLVEDYPFSTLHGKLGHSKLLIPVCEDTTLIFDTPGTLKWLNTPSNAEKLEGFKMGIRHTYFKSKKCRVTNRPLLMESDLL